jgi:hypothetical protein
MNTKRTINVPAWPPKGVHRKHVRAWHFGTWIQCGLAGGGSVSVDAWRSASGECFVGINACSNLTVEQARELARTILSAAECAVAEDASGVQG